VAAGGRGRGEREREREEQEEQEEQEEKETRFSLFLPPSPQLFSFLFFSFLFLSFLFTFKKQSSFYLARQTDSLPTSQSLQNVKTKTLRCWFSRAGQEGGWVGVEGEGSSRKEKETRIQRRETCTCSREVIYLSRPMTR
jgi:hypothetical protein